MAKRVVKMNGKRQEFVNMARDLLGQDRTTITRPEIMLVM